MKTNSILAAFCLLLAPFLFPGCDYVDRRTLDRERADSIYRDAMADYAAGRVDQAVAGLERVAAASPANSSARFQLACLLQDTKKDYLGAICHYREFLLLDKSGDKQGLARERIAQCERLLGPVLVKRFALGGDASLADENAGLKARIVALEKTNADLEKRLERAMVRAQESAGETERMKRMLKGEVAEETAKPVIDTEAALLDDEDDGREDRIRFSKDVKNLVLDEAREKTSTPFAVAGDKPAPAKPAAEPAHEKRPSEYVVQDGDTLYKLAVRFYGKRAAWNLIREANKAVISTDGRIKTGQRLVLP